MREVDGDLVGRACTTRSTIRKTGGTLGLVVDSREACLREAGELIQAGITPGDVCEIGELVGEDAGLGALDDHSDSQAVTDPSHPPSAEEIIGTGTPPSGSGRQGPITIFKSVGVGLQDVAIAAAVVEKAGVMGLGTVLRGYD